MPLTVATLERDLITLDGLLLKKVGLDGNTANGANESLRIPIRRAVKRMGVTVAGSAVADDELATLAAADEDTTLQLAHLRTLELCRDNWVEYDETDGDETQSMSQLTKALDDRIAVLKEELGSWVVEPASTSLPGAPHATEIRAGRGYPRHSPGYWRGDYDLRCYP